MPGDGLIDLPGWRRMVEAAGYDGPVEVEIFSAKKWWQTAPDVMVRTIVDRMNTAY
jgi:sugar phosphate isomerase/epimerase